MKFEEVTCNLLKVREKSRNRICFSLVEKVALDFLSQLPSEAIALTQLISTVI